jgi:hypothetical protein
MEDYRPIPEDRKLLNSNFAIDAWLAAHINLPGGFPSSKPE